MHYYLKQYICNIEFRQLSVILNLYLLVEYLFKDLEHLVNALYFASVPTVPTHHYVINTLFAEVTAIRKKLKDMYMQPWDNHVLVKFTVLHHHGLMQMQDKILKQINEHLLNCRKNLSRTETGVSNDFLVAYNELCSLSELFQEYFGKNIPKWEPIHELHQKVLRTEVEGYLSVLKKSLQAEPDQRLVAHILEPLLQFIDSQVVPTWHDLFYCRLLYQEFMKLIHENLLVSTQDLIGLLYLLNFNSVAFYKYLTAYITESNTGNYLNHLYYFKKSIRQMYVKQGIAYKMEESSLSPMVEKWLKEEIRYQEKIVQDSGLRPVETSAPEPVAGSEKIRANLSVAELAYFNGVLLETNVIKTGNRRELYEFVAKNYCTKNSDKISSESLRSKFYTSETGVKSAVKDVLIGMLNYINADLRKMKG